MPVRVMKAPAGSGKTHSYIDRIATRPVTALSEVYVPTIALAEEVKLKIDALNTGHRVALIKGRDQLDAGGLPLCQRHVLATQLAAQGISVFPTLCMKRTMYGLHKCQHYDHCGYVGQFLRCNVRIYTHAHLVLERTMLDETMPTVVVIDEDFTQKLVVAVEVPFYLLAHVSQMPQFSGAVQAITAWVQSQNHTSLLSDYQRLTATGGSWSDLAMDLLQVRPSITPGDLDAVVGTMVVNHQNVRPVATLLAHLDRVLSLGLAPGAVDVRQNGLVVHHRQSISRFGDLHAQDAPRVYIVDATISEPIVRQCLPVHYFENVHTPRNAVVYQCADSICSTSSLDPTKHSSHTVQQRAVARLADVQSLVDEIAATGVQTLVVGPSAITGNPRDGTPSKLTVAPNVQLAHFGAVRGIDSWKDCEALVLVGRNEPRVDVVENIARALFCDDPVPLQLTGVWVNTHVGYEMASGEKVGVVVTGHADPRVHEVLMQLREAESIQALDRLRLIFNEAPKLVIVLSKVPLPGLKVDQLMNWGDLTRGDDFERLYRQHGGVLPLSASWIAAQTGKTLAAAKKAVQRLSKRGQTLLRFYKWRMSPLKPPTPGQYRLPGQRVWSRFLHGYQSVQAAQPALENLLGEKVKVKTD